MTEQRLTELLRLFDLYAANLLQGANAQAAATRDQFRAILSADRGEQINAAAQDTEMPSAIAAPLQVRQAEGRTPVAAAPSTPQPAPAPWRVEAVRWLRRKAADQATANAKWPRHAEAYPSWENKVRDLGWLADELEAEQEAAPYGLDALATPQPDTVQVPREPTQDMLYAMAELDGWKRGDREHPMLTRWEDYWNAAIAAAPVRSSQSAISSQG